jgi:hypothetical protein
MSNKCTVCGEPAFAFRQEKNGVKSYLCAAHIPVNELPTGQIMADEGKGSDRGDQISPSSDR